MLSIVESIEGIVEALRNISRCNDDPGKLAVSSVERETQIRLFRPRWESCGGLTPPPPKKTKTVRPPYFFPPPPPPHPPPTTAPRLTARNATTGGAPPP